MGNAVSSPESPLIDAVLNDDFSEVKDLIRNDQADTKVFDSLGRSVVHLAASRGNETILKYLIEVGAEPDLGDNVQRTPLFYACESSSQACVAALLALGPRVRVNAKDVHGYTPLMSAVSQGSIDIVKSLLARDDIDVSLKGPGGRTAAGMARDRGETAILALLSQAYTLTARRQEGAFSYGMTVHDAPVAYDGPISSIPPASASTGVASSSPTPTATPEVRLKDAQGHAEAGRHEAAIATATDVLHALLQKRGSCKELPEAEHASLCADAYLLRADRLQALGQVEAAQEDYSQALGYLARDSRLRKALAGRAQTNLLRGQSSSSVRQLREAVSDAELALRLERTVALQAGSIRVDVQSLQRLVQSTQTALEAADESYSRYKGLSSATGGGTGLREKTHYEVLKVPKDCDAATLKAAYRTLSLACHPDKLGWAESRARQRAGMKFRRLAEAHAVLTDPTRRAFYEMELKAAEEGQGTG